MLNSDITLTEWCRFNKVAKSTMYHWLKMYRESEGDNSKRKGWIETNRKEIKKAKALAITNISAPTSLREEAIKALRKSIVSIFNYEIHVA